MTVSTDISSTPRRRLLPHRIHTRLILFFLVVLLIPGILVPLFSLSHLRSVFLDAKVDESLLTVRQHTRLLEGQLEMRSVELLMVSQMSEFRRFFNAATEETRQQEKRYLIQALQSYLLKRADLIQGVKVLDAQGIQQFVIRNDLEIDMTPVNRSGAGFYIGAMNVSAIRGQDIPVYVSHPTPESPIYYSSLVLDDAGMIAGVLVLEVTLNSLMDTLLENTPGKLCQIFDARGRPLIHRYTVDGKKVDCKLEHLLEPSDMRYILGRPLGVLSNISGGGDQMYLFARARPRGQSAIQWTAVYVIPLERILVPFQQAAGIVGSLTLISVAVAVVIAMGFSRQISRPLSQLATAANDLCQGYWDTLLPETKYDDEVRDLTGAFGVMCRQLKLAHEDLLKKVEDLHASEKSQIEEKERLVVTLRSIGEAVLATDLSGRIEIANARAAELFDTSTRDLIGNAVEDFVSLYNQTLGEALGDLVELAGASGEKMPLAHHELLLMRKGKEPLQVEVAVSPIRNEKSQIFGVVIVIRDVTESRKMLLERNRVEKLQSLGVLAGGIAHDFNNLISVVMGDLSLLAEDGADRNEARRIAEHALQATERARKLTGQLLTFSKGGAPIRKTASLRDLLTETADFALHGTKCTCEVKVQPKLWLANVDPEQIHQVFHNLTINAVQSMPHGGTLEIVLENVELSEQECPPLPEGKYLRVQVKDEGDGIASEDLSSIFDPYFTTKPTGHGLGLSTVYSIVQAHGGLIQVKSSGTGTTFTVHLPASPEGAVLPPPPPKPRDRVIEALRVLVLDDDPAIRMTSSRLLKHIGHDVTPVECGKEAVRIFKEAFESDSPFDLVILDLTLPGGKSGAQVLEDLKEIHPEVVAIVSSGYSQDPVMAHFSEYGFQGMLQKPYTLGELQACLRRVVS
ncbi:MAG: response regulator [Verrucomicrobia bacterium]|nr:response regulator [Verrucomicrobiota bacterium]MCH8527157.1 response regulator [Kiritimatiellia bacterium]